MLLLLTEEYIDEISFPPQVSGDGTCIGGRMFLADRSSSYGIYDGSSARLERLALVV